MLVVTIHDVAPPTLPAVTALRLLAAEWGAARATLLAVPSFHGRAPIAAHPPTIDWLRRRADAGDEIALHGIYHLQTGHVQTGPAGALDGLRARAFTAGEAEMLGDGAAAPGPLARARDDLAALVRAPIRGFVAPAWLEPRGLGDVLARLGLDWHETGLAIERLRDRRWIISPVIGFATRSRLRLAASLAWAAAVTPLVDCASPERPARIALHPSDLASPRVLAAAARAVRRLARSRPAVTTAEALGVAGEPTAGFSSRTGRAADRG